MSNLFESKPIALNRYEYRLIVGKSGITALERRPLDKSKMVKVGDIDYYPNDWLWVHPGDAPRKAFRLIKQNATEAMKVCRKADIETWFWLEY